MLSLRGHSVTTCETGTKGLTAALQNEFDLMILDLRLPELDGWEVARQVRLAKPEFPIIACSANLMHAERKRTKELGCNGFLGKPYTISDLISTIEDYENGHHPKRTSQ
ncbi:MAG: response regulator [Candidatus Dormibacteria bacterium]